MSESVVPRNRFWVGSMLYVFFTLSGACALIYQIGWVRLLSLELGSTTIAVTTVVSVFMGGLAVGSIWGGRIGSRIFKPLFAYGCLETALAGYVLASPYFFAILLKQVGFTGSYFSENLLFLTALRFGTSVFLLLPPTVLMGATLPILSSWMSRRAGEGGFRTGILYSVNTVGATLGVVTGGLWLLPSYGISFSLRSAAILNLLIGIACIALSMHRVTAVGAVADPRVLRDHREVTPNPDYVPLVAIGLAAVGTMACQVIWTRVTTLVLGVSVYAFTVVLAVFLAGLSIGAWLVTAGLRNRIAAAGVFFGWLLLASAIVIQVTGHLFPYLPVWSIWLYSKVDLAAGGTSLIYIQLLLASALLLVPTFVFGGLFPAALYSYARPSQDVSFVVGKIYAWNVVGSIIGVLLAGFIVLPLLGATRSLIAVSFIMIATFFLLRPKVSVSVAATLILAGVVGLRMPPWDKQLMSSGPHSYAKAYRGHHSHEALSAHLRKSREILYYADGLTSTVVVTRHIDAKGQENLLIYTDGKIDGSSHFDMPTQRLAAHLPVLLHPRPERVAVIGMGTGSTAGSAALHPDVHVDVIEIESKMVEGARLFKAHNHSVHTKNNVDIVVNDGRLYLLRKHGAYDVIISVPSNPWLAGSTNLFTVDFFRRASQALKENGLFAQWLQLYGMEPDSLQMVIRGFIEAFPEAVLATTIPHTDVLLIGTNGNFDFDPDRIGKRLTSSHKIRVDLADTRVGVHSVYDLLARIRVLPADLRELAGYGGMLHTDNHPVLSYRAPLELYRKTGAYNERLIEFHATGIGPALFQENPQKRERIKHLSALAEAYERFRPGGAEALATKDLYKAETLESGLSLFSEEFRQLQSDRLRHALFLNHLGSRREINNIENARRASDEDAEQAAMARLRILVEEQNKLTSTIEKIYKGSLPSWWFEIIEDRVFP